MKRIIALWLVALMLAAQPIQAAVCVGFGQTESGGSCGSLVFSGAPGETETFENAEGSFCTDGFAETDPDGIISTYSATQYKNGSHSAYVGLTGSQTNINYLRADLGAGDSSFTFSFWLYSGSLSAWNNSVIFTLSEGASTPYNGAQNTLSTMLQDQNGGTQFKVRIYAYTGGTSVAGTINYSTGTWIRLQYEFRSGGSSDVKIYNSSNTLQETINIAASPTRSPRYAFWGEVMTPAQTTIRSFYIDDAQYNSTNP